ncbi:MAG: cytochrome c [Deltaproteobacteria bacterium]|nr:cytochrome c [Deltaproteobacteria bacterium]
MTSACRQDMHNQAKYRPMRETPFFADHRSARPLVAGTIARGKLGEDKLLTTGRDGDKFSSIFPFPITADLVARGRERFNIYCSPCHGRTGEGRGMVVQRGYKQPPSFHDARLRDLGPGYFFNVITNGFGVMPGYAVQVPATDRWAITSYIRALQLSRNASVDDLTSEEKSRLTKESSGG